jgi:hypothetical protein
VDYDARANLGKNIELPVCGVSWLLRVTDHEAVLMDPKLFSSQSPELGSQVSGVVETKVWTLNGRARGIRWRFSRKNG